MLFNPPTIATVVLVIIGALVAAPTLIKGFTRAGTGVKYERNFVIQRAPQLCSVFNIVLIVLGFLSSNGLLNKYPVLLAFAATNNPGPAHTAASWVGVLVLLSGLIFMVGGWISLGECFSTDAELLQDHKVRSDGLLSLVMHPAYSGIIQCLLGASLAAVSPLGVLFDLFVVAPLWLRRAKYEEALLIESLGESYKDYAENMNWRRLVPKFIPIGV